MNKLLIKNGKVLLFKQDDVIIEEKEILIDNGKIIRIDNDIVEENCKIIDARNCIVMPGLINTHAHIPMCIFRETTEGIKLYDWLQNIIWPREDKLTKEEVYWASMLTYAEMISTGSTCINDQYFWTEQIRRCC